MTTLMICGGCDKSITAGQPYDTYEIITGGATGGADVHYHRGCSVPKPASSVTGSGPLLRSTPSRRARS